LPKKLPIFYSALLLTGVNLLLRLVGTSFQVYISGRIGAVGVGLLQLTMSVGSLAMVTGIAGVRTATMYLTAEELGKKRPGNVTWVLSGCFVYSILCSTAVAAALTGEITDPRDLGLDALHVDLPDRFLIDDSAVLAPATPEDAAQLEVLRGPNIKEFPQGKPVGDAITAKLTLKVGDNITTDHIMPAGSKILPYRSNIPKLSEFCFAVCDKEFAQNAKAAGETILVGGSNYGQGSSREHAALVPLYLGVRAVIAKSFARIHAANLINAGILPLTFADPDDYDALTQGETLTLTGIDAGLDSGTMTLHAGDREIPVCGSFTKRQAAMLRAGGLLNYTKEGND
jgi:aconitate hydratase